MKKTLRLIGRIICTAIILTTTLGLAYLNFKGYIIPGFNAIKTLCIEDPAGSSGWSSYIGLTWVATIATLFTTISALIVWRIIKWKMWVMDEFAGDIFQIGIATIATSFMSYGVGFTKALIKTERRETAIEDILTVVLQQTSNYSFVCAGICIVFFMIYRYDTVHWSNPFKSTT